jgi:cytochrome c peroxidase
MKKFMTVDLHLPSGQRGLPDLEPTTDQEYRRIELGRKLFFDPVLSSDGSTSCATCHLPGHGFSSPEPVPAGVAGSRGRRHPPSLVNRRWGKVHFWDGRSATLEDQALHPIESEHELASSVDDALARIAADVDYPALFDRAFEEGITRDSLAGAIASFERSLVSSDSPIDRFVTASGEGVLTRSQRQGLWIYESKGGCWQCHSGPNYSDEQFHNTGVSWGREPLDLGLFEITGIEENKGQFKTPTLRDVALSSPYMHDGSIATLAEVVEFYNKGGTANPHLDRKLKPLNLSDQEKLDLEEFLKALTGRHVWD